MAQESIPADSKRWDGKKIVLTDTTKKNMMKKAYVLDSESLLAQSGMTSAQGEDAVNAVETRGITQEQLVQTPQTYSNLAFQAIVSIEANESKESRMAAVQALKELNYTNIYDSTTQDFITPAAGKEEKETKEVVAAEPETPAGPKSNPYYNKGAKNDSRVEAVKAQARAQSNYLKEQNARVRQQQTYEQQLAAREEQMDKSQYIQNTSQGNSSNNFLARLTPNAGRRSSVVRPTEVNNYGRGPTTNPSMVERMSIRPRVGAQPTQPQPQQQRQVMQQPRPSIPRPALNPAVAAKFGSVGLGRKNPVTQNPTMGMGGMRPQAGGGMRSNVMAKLTLGKKKI